LYQVDASTSFVLLNLCIEIVETFLCSLEVLRTLFTLELRFRDVVLRDIFKVIQDGASVRLQLQHHRLA
jgi:hypothetical protein